MPWTLEEIEVLESKGYKLAEDDSMCNFKSDVRTIEKTDHQYLIGFLSKDKSNVDYVEYDTFDEVLSNLNENLKL